MNIQEAIKSFEYDNNVLSAKRTATHQRNEIAISALREQEARDKGCEYCNAHGKHMKHIQDSVTLYKNVGDGKNAPYIKAELLTGGDNEQAIRIESASENKVNRGTFTIKFCPMCGKKL